MGKTLRELQEIFDIRTVRRSDGTYDLIATARYGYGQPFWCADHTFSDPDDAMRSPDLYGPRGPSY
jgi:hypothetical protein